MVQKKGSATKKMTGKSLAKANVNVPAYKPSIYLDDKQIPKSLANTKPGTKVTLQVTGQVVSRSERVGGPSSVSIELSKITAPAPGKKRGS